MFSWVRRNPVDATTHEIKSLNYLNSVLAKIEANACGVDEAICLEGSGCVAEGVGENIFIVKNGEILTPPTSTGALAGITAEVVAETCRETWHQTDHYQPDTFYDVHCRRSILHWHRYGNGANPRSQ